MVGCLQVFPTSRLQFLAASAREDPLDIHLDDSVLAVLARDNGGDSRNYLVFSCATVYEEAAGWMEALVCQGV